MREEDTALYTCTASSESGETSWSASLSVEKPTNPNIIFHRTPDPSTFPQPPSKPKIVDRRSTSITISWRSSDASTGASPLIGYTVEYFSFDLETGWVVAAHRVTSETYTVGNLRPDTSYLFLVRAENSHGMSPPTQVTDRVRTLRALSGGDGGSVDEHVDLNAVQDVLMNKVVELTSIEAISSTMIRVSWETLTESDFVAGYHVRFRDMSGGSQKFNMKTVMRDGDEGDSYVISNLRKFTEYEVFLMPFYGRVEGQPSNSLHVQTLEDVPSAPPGNVRADMLNGTSVELKWAPPPPQHRNGVLLGYQIHVKEGNGSAFHSNVTLNATTTRFALTNLSVNEDYSVRACAMTNAGHGPFSDPVAFSMDPALVKYPIVSHPADAAAASGLITEPWFVTLLGAVVFALLLVFFLSIVAYRRQWSRRKSSSSGMGHLPVPVQRYEDMRNGGGNDTVWINGNWKQGSLDLANNGYYTAASGGGGKDAAGNDLYAEVGEIDDNVMSTFNNGGGFGNTDPAPYATTTLAMQNKMRTLNGNTFISLPQTDPSTAAVAAMSQDLLSHRTTSSSGGDTTTSLSHHHKSPSVELPSAAATIGGNSGSGGRSNNNSSTYIPNWSDIFPPPPECPPPPQQSGIDVDSPANSPRSGRRLRQQVT